MKAVKQNQQFRNALKALGMALICIPFLASAQQMPGQAPQEVKEDFSDGELKSFVEVVKVQQKSQLKMVGAIEETGLDVETFNQILMTQQQEGGVADLPKDEIAKFEQASQQVNDLQVQMQQNMAKKLSEQGLAMETYSELMYSYQNSPKVQQKVDMLMAQE